MIARELEDGRTILIRQEDHADLSAQFASHWGNGIFSKPDPYESMVFGAGFHDTHFRETETDLPMDLKSGRPLSHRKLPFSPAHVDALRQNIGWVARRDPYAALLISMHHTGLPQNRYGVIRSWQNDYGNAPKRPSRPEMAGVVRELEADQRTIVADLVQRDAGIENQIRHNYRLLQVFDLLSLYLCCDGDGSNGLKEARIEPVPLGYRLDREVSIRILPDGDRTIRLDPYPFDASPLKVCLMSRVMSGAPGSSTAECRSEFFRSVRKPLTWTLTD